MLQKVSGCKYLIAYLKEKRILIYQREDIWYIRNGLALWKFLYIIYLLFALMYFMETCFKYLVIINRLLGAYE